MEDKRAVTIISMSHNKDRAEVVVKTTLANGKMKSVTRHINRKPDGTWQGIVSSDRVVRNHAEAGKQLNAAHQALKVAQNDLKRAENTRKEAHAAAAKDPSDKVRAKANTADAVLKAAKESLAEAQEASVKARARMAAVVERQPLVVGYLI